jgi:hypothetical protein
VVRQPLGFDRLPAKAGRILAGLHLAFSRKCHPHPKIYDADVISAF